MPRRRTSRRRTRKGGGWFSCGKYFCGVADIFEAKQLVLDSRGEDLRRLAPPSLEKVKKIVQQACYAAGNNSKYGKCNGIKVNDANTVKVDDVANQILQDLRRPSATPRISPRRTVTARRSPPKTPSMSNAAPGSLVNARLQQLQGKSMGTGDGTHRFDF